MFKVTTRSNKSIYENMFGHEAYYGIGEITRAPIKGSKLFVFDTLESAELFCLNRDNVRVYECECDNAKYPVAPIATLSHDFIKFWKNPDDVISKRAGPKGTMLCDSVMLTELIFER